MDHDSARIDAGASVPFALLVMEAMRTRADEVSNNLSVRIRRLPGWWQDQEMRTAEWMLPAQCTATISSRQRFAGVQVPAEHSYGSF